MMGFSGIFSKSHQKQYRELLSQLEEQRAQAIHLTMESANFAKLLEGTRDLLCSTIEERDALKTQRDRLECDLRQTRIALERTRAIAVVCSIISAGGILVGLFSRL
jgi:hypothetical protein